MTSERIVLNADKKSKLLVYGYIHNAEKILLPKRNPYYIITDLIVYLCINYFYIKEYFVRIGHQTMTNKARNVVKYTGSSGSNSCYGNIDIRYYENVIYKWKFKILQDECSDIYIGIDSIQTGRTHGCFCEDWTHNAPHYAIGGGYKSSNDPKQKVESALELRKGDIIRMELSCKTKTLCYQSDAYDEITKTIIFRNIILNDDIIYHMVVSLGGENDCVKLIQFESEFI